MKITRCLIFIMMLFFSCTKVYDEIVFKPIHDSPKKKTKIYTIVKGGHYSDGNNFQLLHLPELRFEVNFDNSAIYRTEIAENQYDINKLYGFADCETAHHENSARFGWRWNGHAVELHAYCYNASKRNILFLESIPVGKAIELAIGIRPNEYIFEIAGRKYPISRHCSTTQITGYKLYPYFGGDEVAPHDITISIRDL